MSRPLFLGGKHRKVRVVPQFECDADNIDARFATVA